MTKPVFFTKSRKCHARFYLQRNFEVVIKFLKFKMLEAKRHSIVVFIFFLLVYSMAFHFLR